MIVGEKSELRKVNGITEDQRQRIIDFLQGAVYCWCNNRKNEPFALRYLVGGENWNWGATPLQVLYDKQGKDSHASYKKAAREAGWLLKRVIHEDERLFDIQKNRVNHYLWLSE